jgi:hypothetical protein
MSKELLVVGLDRMPYGSALDLQRAVAHARIDGRQARDVLLLVEHPPVITLGRSTEPQHLPVSAEQLAARGVEVHDIERGGDVTFHGPGQLVGYPIYDLSEHRRDLHWYLRQLEAALIAALAHFGIAGGRNEGFTGVWTGGRAVGHLARLRAQRHDRPVVLRPHRALRHRRRRDDQRAAGAGRAYPARRVGTGHRHGDAGIRRDVRSGAAGRGHCGPTGALVRWRAAVAGAPRHTVSDSTSLPARMHDERTA